MPLRHIKLFFIPNKFALFVLAHCGFFRGLAGWELRLRPLRFWIASHARWSSFWTIACIQVYGLQYFLMKILQYLVGDIKIKQILYQIISWPLKWIPSKHKTLAQCWVDVQQLNNGPTPRVCRVIVCGRCSVIQIHVWCTIQLRRCINFRKI